jgi:hypothetical protein
MILIALREKPAQSLRSHETPPISRRSVQHKNQRRVAIGVERYIEQVRAASVMIKGFDPTCVIVDGTRNGKEGHEEVYEEGSVEETYSRRVHYGRRSKITGSLESEDTYE